MIQEEVKDLFNMILLHPDQIDKLDLFIRLRNGTIFKYHVDKKKEEQINLKEKNRQTKLEKKLKAIEKKRKEIQNIDSNVNQ